MAKYVATKLGRKELPFGYTADNFIYKGRPANDQNDFGRDVGVADMACVNQFGSGVGNGEANNNKYYHCGVVQSADGKWWVYLEWGRQFSGNSWEHNSFQGQDFQFVSCPSEQDARAFFADQAASKNTKRIESRVIAGKTFWASGTDSKGKSKDGYLVQRLATRSRGLPDAYKIKDSTGVSVAVVPPSSASTPVASSPTKTFQPQVLSLADALIGGTKDYARAAIKATNVTPTQAAIDEVRDDCIPAALKLLKEIGDDLNKQLSDKRLQDLSKYVATIVPRPIPRTGDPMAVLLTSANILSIQQDLDAFEAALKGEDFSSDTTVKTTDPDKLLNATLQWIDPKSELGMWLAATYNGMNDGRHSYARNVKIRNMFAVSRPDRDAPFVAAAQRIALKRKGYRNPTMPRLQPSRRTDLADVGDYAQDASIFMGIHGTRSVNVGPILQTNLRLPKHLSGVHITGAAFGGGIYYACQVGKSAGYVGHGSSYYGSGGGIRGRGYFMFLCDVIGGKFYYPNSAWGIGDRVPGDGDSVFAHPNYVHSLQNDEHVIFSPDQQRIRYLVEIDF